MVRANRPHLAAHVESTLARLGHCRTAVLGGHTYRCQQCGEKVSVYNSCSDRHCPQCSGARRHDWLDKTAQLLVPGVTYFQVVFTLPDTLSALILGNRTALYRTLFHAAHESLRELLETKNGMQAASLLVLHTWNQRLGHHPHVHALVPGSGPSLDGQRWIPCRMTKATRQAPARPFLVDNVALGHAFQDVFLKKLHALHHRNELRLEGNCAYLQNESAWQTFTELLQEHDWCVFIERPPTAESTPDQVLKYLARYLTGGPLSDHRLVSCERDVITFRVRSKDKTKQKRKQQELARLSGVEFTRSWSLHILPKGFTKTRCYGGYSNTKRDAYLALCRQFCPMPPEIEPRPTPPSETSSETATDDEPFVRPVPNCPRCQQPMQEVSFTYRPSWREIFYGPDHHPWFES